MAETNERRILLVEDESITRTVVSKMLATFGFEVDVAVDGAQALDRLHETHYDLVFMDCHLPVMDGFEATRRWRAGSGGASPADVTILALTADRRGADVQPCLAAGMNGHLSKPVSLALLNDVVTRWIPHASDATVVTQQA